MTIIINNSLCVLAWGFELLLSGIGFLLSDPKNNTFATLFCWKHPKTRPMCQFHNIYYISYNQQPLKCICSKMGGSTLFPRFFINIFPKNNVLWHILPKLPQKCSHLRGLSQILLMTVIINTSLSVLVWSFQLLLSGIGFLLSDPKNLTFPTFFAESTPKTHPMCQLHNIYYISYNQQPKKCICARFGDSTLFPRFFINIFPKNHVLWHLLPKMPQK